MPKKSARVSVRASGKRTSGGRVAPLSRLAVAQMDEDGGEHDTVIAVAQILYCCLGRAALSGPVDGKWKAIAATRPGWVYARTPQLACRTHFRTIAALLERLPENFMQVNQGVALNLDKIDCHELGRGRRRRVAVRMPSRPKERELEWIVVSRRHLRELRERIGLPSRR